MAGLTVSNINSTNLLRDVEFTQTREAWVKLLEVYLTTSVLCGNDVIQRLESLTNLHDEDIAELVQFLRPYIESQSDTAEGRALSTLLQEEPLDALAYLSRQMNELQPQQHPSVDEVCTQLYNPLAKEATWFEELVETAIDENWQPFGIWQSVGHGTYFRSMNSSVMDEINAQTQRMNLAIGLTQGEDIAAAAFIDLDCRHN